MISSIVLIDHQITSGIDCIISAMFAYTHYVIGAGSVDRYKMKRLNEPGAFKIAKADRKARA
jgi:hypothetical protein